MIKVNTLPSIAGLEEITLRAGHKGADSIIRWPYVAESNDIGDWISGGELIFVTGLNWQWQAEDFIYLIEVAKENNASGLVILTQSAYIRSIPDEVLVFADEKAFPLFEQPYSLPMVKVTELLSNAIMKADLAHQSARWLMQQLLESASPPAEITLIRAAEFGINTKSAFSVAVVVPNLKQGGKFSLCQFLLNQFLSAHQSEFPLLEYYQGWLLSLPYDIGGGNDALEKWRELRALLNQKGFNCSIGVSEGEGLHQFSVAASQAKQSVEFALYQGSDTLIHYQELGINQLFARIEDRKQLTVFCQQNLGKLYGCFDKQAAQLRSTLTCYFEHLGSARQTALALDIHRNTLTHRLKKIEDLTGNNLSNAQQRLCLQNALVMERLTLANSIEAAQ